MSHPQPSQIDAESTNGNGAGPSTSNGSGHHTVDTTLTTAPFPASQKVYVDGTLPGVRVAMREITLTPTKTANGGPAAENRSMTIYDTSGPYTDPDVTIDIRAGLAPHRLKWITDRQDAQELPSVTSEYGRMRASDPKLAELRFQHIRKPLRAKAGHNVSQMHYARKGMITPEMEYIAIRENQRREREIARDLMAPGNGHGGGVAQHPGQAWGARIPSTITPEFVRDEVARGRAIIPANINHP